MLSTLATRKGSKALAALRPMFLVRHSASATVVSESEPKYPYEDIFPKSVQPEPTLEEKVRYWKKANEIFFGPQRDLKNFPTPEIPEKIDINCNFFIIPTEWFKQIYPRLGVSGCYSLVWLSLMFCLSKELVVPDGQTGEVMILWLFALYAIRKWGNKIGESLDKESESILEFNYLKPLREAKANYSVDVDALTTGIDSQSAIPTIFEVKKEQVDLQLECQYRERLADVFHTVKGRLDYQADVEAAHRRFEQDLMINWIVDSVEKAITPQQEKESIASCISTLKNLSKTATL